MEHLSVSNSGEVPIASHRCRQLDLLRCDDLGTSDSWNCELASCSSCVDLNWNLYYPASTSQGLPLPYRRIETTMTNITRSAEQGCQTCSILCEGIACVSKSFIEQEELFSDWVCKSLLRIELRHDGPFTVELCPQDDEDTTYLLIEFFSLKGATDFFRSHGVLLTEGL
jgi:hypothetical protein